MVWRATPGHPQLSMISVGIKGKEAGSQDSSLKSEVFSLLTVTCLERAEARGQTLRGKRFRNPFFDRLLSHPGNVAFWTPF